MDQLKKKRTALVAAICGIAVVAWLASMGAGWGIRQIVALPDDASISEIGTPALAQKGPGPTDKDRKPAPTRNTRKSKKHYVEPIVRRNIFDASKVNATTTNTEAIGDSHRKTDLRVVLLATVVAEPEEFSSALIAEEKSDSWADGYGIGDLLLDEATIVRIEQRRVLIRRSDSTIEYIGMDEGKLASRSSKKESDDSSDGVEKTDENKFIVDQDVIDQIIENPEKLASNIRVTPHKDSNGDIDGYRLSGVRRNSLFSKLGVKNGDVVHSVNGRELTSMSGAMDAYTALQEEKNISFEVTRRNQKMNFEYEIR